MNPDRWKKIKTIFNKALELEGAKREVYLNEACGEDENLKKEVVSLIEAYDMPGAIDDSPEGFMTSLRPDHRSEEQQGKQVGPYKIIKLLGHGGMGSVYLAERHDGQFEQEVALKLLRTGFTSENQTRRFLAERQILATLNHDNIARLLDGGITGDGQPWFAMEHVEGKPIDEYCNKHQLTINQRLKLFRKVCSAVQYAHSKLIVHRDLKPSNIFVTKQGTVKLLDFGIAKALRQEEDHPQTNPLTQTGLLPLTPAYASPEQVRGEPMTTASDIYQLGVVLYELLTGYRPYNVKGRRPSEIERIICEEEPTRPSTAVTKVISEGGNTGKESHPTAAGISRDRKTKPDKLQKRLRGDLDTIVLKALRKEPDRRYDSAEQLSSDIFHYLEGRPVTAHPDTVWYRTSKFIRRHKTGVVATAVILMLLIGYAATITWHSQRTQAALEQAKQETAKAEQVTGFLIEMFEATDPAEAMGDTVTTRLLLERGVAQAELLDGQPDIQARMFDVAGRVYMALGQYEDAEPLIEKGLHLREDIYGDDHLIVSESLHNLARLLNEKGYYQQAGKLYQEALELRRNQLPPDDPRIAESLYFVGMFYQRVHSDLQAAESLFRRSLEIRRNNYGTQHAKVAESLRGLGGILLAKGRYTEAETHYREALEIQSNLLGDKHPETITTTNNLAILKAWSGDYSSAITLLRKSLEQRHDVLGPGHPAVAIQLNNLAFIAGHQNDFKEAEKLLNEAISVMQASVGGDHPHALVFRTNLARVKHVTGELDRAEKLHRETLKAKRNLLGPDHPDVAASLVQLGSLLKDQRKYEEAESLLRKAVSIHQNTLSNEHPMLISGYYLLAQLHMDKEEFREAGNLFHETLKIRERNRAVDHTDIAVAHSLQGACLTNLELYGDADSLIADVQELLDKFDGEEQAMQEELVKQIINLYEKWDKTDDANRYRKLLASMTSQLE